MEPAPLRSPARPRLVAALALGVALAVASPPAAAQSPDDLAHARQVFKEAKDHEGKGEWAEALESLKQVATVKMTPQVRFHIALCEENLGRLVSAIKGYDLATEEAKLAGAAAMEVATNAPLRANALRGRVAKLRIDVKGQVISSKIMLDDTALGARDLGADVPVDPGAHAIEVRDASGKSTFHKDVTLAEKGAATVEVTVDDHEEPPPPVPTGDGAGTQPQQAPSKVPIIVAASVGAASLAASGVFWIMRVNTISEIQSHCMDMVHLTGCRPSDQGLESQGQTYTTMAGVFLGVGVVGAVTAGVLAIVNATRKKPADPPKASVRVVPAGNGFQVVGVF